MEKYGLLDKINSPADIKALDLKQLKQLCAELRSYIIECCAENPGHLASSLGAVEIIVGLHYVFDTPEDKIVFDVGHQAYAHKILTGRRDSFRTLRCEGGISGFPKRDESPYDSFGVGHSSTSISAALGFAEAARIQGRDSKVIAVIGDGAMTGGLAYEGLNNAGASQADMLTILNDNNQSIEGNTGGLHEYLLRITTSASYNKLKVKIWNMLGDGFLRGFIQRWVRGFKSWLVGKAGGHLFESLGIRYFGPINGNDIVDVVYTLRRLKNMKGPCLLHCMTVKGCGYGPAEKDPVTWHAPGKFNPETGERVATHYAADRFQDVFGEVLCELAEKDPDIVGITPAMAQGCGMNVFAARYPGRFFDVGIEEEHAVTFSAGLAAGGMKPFCNIYSSFAQRAYDQIIHDVALQNLPVVLCFDRAGLVGEDGGTHHGAFDIAAYRSIPNAVVSAPKDEVELKQLMYSASLRRDGGPYIIRYPRGIGSGSDYRNTPFAQLPLGKAECLAEGSEVAIVACGPVVLEALKAAQKHKGKVAVWNFRFIKPLDTEALDKIASGAKGILTLEDGCLTGGLYGAVCEYMLSRDYTVKVHGLGIPDSFIGHARQSKQHADCGLDFEGIEKSLSKLFGDL